MFVDVTSSSNGSLVPSETRRWYRFGILAAIGWAVFVVVLLVLLEWNLVVGLVFAVVASVAFGVVFTYVIRFVW